MLFKLLFLLCIYKASSFGNVSHLKKETFDLGKAKNIFDEFIEKFRKQYDTKDEYERRFEIFKKNLEDVNNRNKNATTEVYGITQFLDKSDEEFKRDYTGLKLNTNSEDLHEEPDDLEPMINNNDDYYYNVPDSWDWRDQGVVTPARDQGECSSCWAFSAVGCVESQFAIKHSILYALSEQQLVDCFYEGNGCITGSYPDAAMNAAAKMGGLMKLKDYPYEGRQGQCRLNKRQIAVKVNGARLQRISNEEQLKKLVYEYGPVSIAIEATRGFDQYKGGISTYEGLRCAPHHNANHAVILVGYGTENGVPFWIIKNSHGQNWGEQGFMRLIRGRNACSILQYIAIADVP